MSLTSIRREVFMAMVIDASTMLEVEKLSISNVKKYTNDYNFTHRRISHYINICIEWSRTAEGLEYWSRFNSLIACSEQFESKRKAYQNTLNLMEGLDVLP